MEDVTLAHAKEHLEELVRRAAAGEEVRIVDPEIGAVTLGPSASASAQPSTTKSAPQWDITAPRVTDTMPKFVPLKEPRKLGQLAGKMQVPARLMEPMTDDELRDWYGDDA